MLVNEWLARRHNQRKVSTDMAAPDQAFAEMLDFYKETLEASRLRYVIFGHIGDNHVHVNIMPRDEREASAAREIYRRFVRRAVELGGTISAEHGVGKIKRDYLRELYGEAWRPIWIEKVRHFCHNSNIAVNACSRRCCMNSHGGCRADNLKA